MKTRIISAVVGLMILAVAIAFYDTIIFNLFIAALALIGIYEAHHAAGLTKNHWRITLYSALFAVFILLVPQAREYAIPAIYVLTVLVFAYTLEHHKTFTIREGAYALLMGIALPVVFGLILLFRDKLGNEQGLLYLAFLLGSAWWSDIGGYFSGMLFGKHKLCPEISPKKTVEGMIGGILTVGIAVTIQCLVYNLLLPSTIKMNYAVIIPVGMVASVLGVLGDLSASVIKRQYNIKAFSNIMPGHGGILDRFDSVLFVAPFIYVVFRFLSPAM